MRLPLTFPVLAAAAALSACVPQPVHWDEAVARTEGTLADSVRLTLGEDGASGFAVAWRPATWPSEAGLCTATLRAVPALAGEAYASWFTARPDSSVLLRVARSDDGGLTWNAAVTADTTDVGRTGCARPTPFLAADSLNGYVHLVYHLEAREGAGLFFTHSMERGALFHEPVPIVYGDRPSSASVASRGDTVIVAYEDPNSRLPRLGLALSRTQGHIFESRLSASDENGEARGPLVAVRGARIVVAWTATQRGGGLPRIMVRQGTLAW
jgi:hypothetical protein